MTTTNAAAEIVDEERRREFVEVARDFAQREIAPYAAEWDREKKYPADVIKQLGELGFLGLLSPSTRAWVRRLARSLPEPGSL